MMHPDIIYFNASLVRWNQHTASATVWLVTLSSLKDVYVFFLYCPRNKRFFASSSHPYTNAFQGSITATKTNIKHNCLMSVKQPWSIWIHPTVLNHSITRHDDVIKWKHFPRYWPFVRVIYWCMYCLLIMHNEEVVTWKRFSYRIIAPLLEGLLMDSPHKGPVERQNKLT